MNQLEFLVVSEQTRDRLVSATKEDKDLRKLIKLIKQGFPMQYKVLEPELKHLYKFRDYLSTKDRGCPRGVMVKAMNCGIVVREFVLQSRYYVHFRANTLGKGMNPLILPPAMGK